MKPSKKTSTLAHTRVESNLKYLNRKKTLKERPLSALGFRNGKEFTSEELIAKAREYADLKKGQQIYPSFSGFDMFIKMICPLDFWVKQPGGDHAPNRLGLESAYKIIEEAVFSISSTNMLVGRFATGLMMLAAKNNVKANNVTINNQNNVSIVKLLKPAPAKQININESVSVPKKEKKNK